MCPWNFILSLVGLPPSFSLDPDHGTPDHSIWFFLPFDASPSTFSSLVLLHCWLAKGHLQPCLLQRGRKTLQGAPRHRLWPYRMQREHLGYSVHLPLQINKEWVYRSSHMAAKCSWNQLIYSEESGERGGERLYRQKNWKNFHWLYNQNISNSFGLKHPSRRFQVSFSCATSSGFRRSVKDPLRRHHSQASVEGSISALVSSQI